ncbi:mediator of RNA polymerase II transcription subunit 16 [Naviculisporaceae sp. PSN 640]
MSAHDHGHGGLPLLLDSAMSVDGDMHVMDNAMGLDHVDLFGDPVMDNPLDNPLDLPSRPLPSKQLRQRLEELRTRGCCQGIAWSRQGTIASISKDGRSIDLRFLHSRPDNGAWELSEPYSCSNALSPPAGLIAHLAWGVTSSPDLAVIDTVGRISILSFSITLNRCYAVKKWDADHVDDLQAVVGCYWLPLAMNPTRNYIHGPAVWRPERNEYQYQVVLCPTHNPAHPNPGKSALVCVTTNGMLKLIYSQHNNRIEETSLELESVTSSDDLITHASLCSDRNMLLIALATASKQLRIVRAQLSWGLPQQADKQAPPGAHPLNPTIKDQHVTATTWLQQDPDELSLDTSMAQLSHIEMLPTLIEVRRPDQPKDIYPALLITVRSYIPPGPSYNQDCQSIIDRWELSEQPQTVHEAFEQLGPKHNAESNSPMSARLHRLEPIIVPKIVMSVSTLQQSKVICFVFNDGTVQYRDRVTMRELYTEPDLNNIMSPHQVGFQFSSETPCLQAAFSPTTCSLAQICEDGEVKWNSMYFPMEDINTTMQDNQYSAILAAMTVAIAGGASLQSNCDDMLAIARPFAQKPEFVYDWIRQLVQMLKIAVDYSEEAHHDQLVRNHNLQLCLSILNHLGFRGEFQPRSFGGKFAMLTLNVRNIVILITIANNMPLKVKEKLSPLDEPEVVDALGGCAKWAIDLLTWLSDCLFQLADDPTFMAILSDPRRFPELAGYLQAQGDVSLHLLLCSSTRGFLSAACRRLSHLEALSNRAAQFNHSVKENQQAQQQQKEGEPTRTVGPPPALLAAYQKIQRFIGSSPVKVGYFEALVNQLNTDIRMAYHASLPGIVNNEPPEVRPDNGQPLHSVEQRVKRRQAAFELDMLLASNPPPSFREVIFNFFNNNLAAFKAQTDPAKLYFGNFDLLDVEDDPRSLARKKQLGKYIDVFKRVEVYSGGKMNGGTVALPKGAAAAGAGSNSNNNGLSSGLAVGSTPGIGKKMGPTSAGNPNLNLRAGVGGNDGASGATAAVSSGSSNNAPVPQWRRCVRCAAVMEDVWGHRPGFTFVLAQQRKCSCGGNWGLVPKSSIRP